MVHQALEPGRVSEGSGLGDDLDVVLVFNLLKTHSTLSQLIDADLRRQRLTAAQFNALLVLRAGGEEGLLMNEIGRRLVVTKSNVTGLVDRLERDGLVTRSAHRDRRATVVRLSPKGARMMDRIVPRHAALVSELTGCLSEREKRTVVKLLTKLRRELRRRRARSTA